MCRSASSPPAPSGSFCFPGSASASSPPLMPAGRCNAGAGAQASATGPCSEPVFQGPLQLITHVSGFCWCIAGSRSASWHEKRGGPRGAQQPMGDSASSRQSSSAHQMQQGRIDIKEGQIVSCSASEHLACCSWRVFQACLARLAPRGLQVHDAHSGWHLVPPAPPPQTSISANAVQTRDSPPWRAAV